MGLIQAAVGAVGGVFADQWKEYFYCDSINEDTLAVKGQKRTSGRSSNTKGEDNIISNGSVIAVNEGQCMIIVEQGKVVELCAEPGAFTWNSSTEPSIFTGKLGSSILETFKAIGRRFTFGGDTGKDQRVYYFNTKEIIGNKYGTATPVPFRVVDRNANMDLDIGIRCNGEFSYRVTDPILFYTNVCGNVEPDYKRERIDSMLRTELLTALQPAFAKISEMGIRYSALPGHTEELANILNEVLTKKGKETRGLEIANVGVNSVSANPEDEALIKEMQKRAALRDPTLAAATIASAQADAMVAAAKNENGALGAFMGFGMAQQAGGVNAANLYAMGSQYQQQPAVAPAVQSAGWTCAQCGADNTGKFCAQCGAKRPETAAGWTCPKCGAVCKGKFCPECGESKPSEAPVYRCDKCGWEPADPQHPPRFCPECGDPFDENDIKG